MNGRGRIRLQAACAQPPAGMLPAGDYVRVAVSDNGPGMSPEVAAKVFEPFFTTKGVGKGTGLGLSQVYGMAQQSGGGASVHSVPGEGATIEIWMPAAHDAAVGERSATVDRRKLAGLRVLVVEDQQDSREIVVAALQHHGVEVEEAATSEEALAAIDRAVASRRLPDVIVSDIGLPGEDGYRLIEQISLRAPSRGGAIPLIALTAYGSSQDKRRALAAGFRTHLTKPVEPNVLAAAVAAVAGRTPGE